MTITLHWWLVPLLIACVGLIVGACGPRGMDGIGHAFLGVALVLIAAAVCLGHWL